MKDAIIICASKPIQYGDKVDNNDELIDDIADEMPGANVLQLSWDLYQELCKLKQSDSANGRIWAIAATDAEKLHAWISYAVSVINDPQ